MADNQPEETLRDGNLKATIWVNEGEKGPYVSVTLAKTYTDDNGKYQDTNSFSQSDLLRVAELSRQAYVCGNELKRELYQDHDRNSGRSRSRDSASGAFDRENGRGRSRGRSYSR